MKKALFLCAIALCAGFASCSDDDDDVTKTDGVTTFTNGAFVLNEGNFGTNGHVGYVSRATGTYTDSVYYKVNNKMLGNITESMCFANGKVYIVSQLGENNGSEGFIVEADAKTFKKIKSYSPKELVGKNPDQIAVVGNNIYVHSSVFGANYTSIYNIYMIDKDGKVSLVEGTSKADNKAMIVYNGKLYAMTTGNEILVIENGKVASTIKTPGNLTGIRYAGNGILWAAMAGDYNGISKIDLNRNDNQVVERHKIAEPLTAPYSHVSSIAVKGNNIYFCGGTTTIYKHDFAKNTTAKMVDVVSVSPNAAMYYNSLAVDPITGDVYFASLKDYSVWQTNATVVFTDNGTTLAKKWEFANKNAMPAGVFFAE